MSSIPPSEENATYLYAIRAKYTPYVKVGITSNPAGRIKRMQTENPFALRFVTCVSCDRAYDIEQWIHGRLRRQHVQGEWFCVYWDRTILNLIAQGLGLGGRGELPPAPTAIEKNAPIATRAIVIDSNNPRACSAVQSDKSRSNLIRVLVHKGWNVGEIRAAVKGDSGTIGLEVQAARDDAKEIAPELQI